MLAAFFASTIGKYIALAAIFVSVVSGAYFLGKRDQKQADLHTLSENSVKILRERGAIDERVQGSSDADLCRALGGVYNDGCE